MLGLISLAVDIASKFSSIAESELLFTSNIQLNTSKPPNRKTRSRGHVFRNSDVKTERA